MPIFISYIHPTIQNTLYQNTNTYADACTIAQLLSDPIELILPYSISKY